MSASYPGVQTPPDVQWPRSIDSFLSLYTQIIKDDIRRNRNNVAERLGLRRLIYGTNPRAWLKEVRQRVGEGIDFAATAE